MVTFVLMFARAHLCGRVRERASVRLVSGDAVMHFWIDKRSQCGYGGRRLPTSLSAGSGSERRPKRMVTPVHRFQSVECRPPAVAAAAAAAGPSSSRRPGPRRRDPVRGELATREPPERRDLDGAVYLEMGGARGPDPAAEPPPSSRPPQPQPNLPGHLKCGMWASFVLATAFVAGAKVYFDRQIVYDRSAGMEAIVLCALLVVFLLGACTITLCRARRMPASPPSTPSSLLSPSPAGSRARTGGQSGLAVRPSLTRQIAFQESSEDLALGTILSLQAVRPPGPPSPEPPPPPYHIAVLLPQRSIVRSEVPPPTYEKAIS